jgi:hypothetical protein
MTLIQTAKLNGVDPMAWLTDVLERICHATRNAVTHAFSKAATYRLSLIS